jgi:nucleotide-binding universal stress UspA family protein
VVAGVDGSPNGARALACAIDIARGAGAEVVAVHAVGLLAYLRPGAPPLPSASCHNELQRVFEHEWCAMLRTAGVPYRTLLVEGEPVHALLAVAAEESAWLIVVGSRGHREFAAVRLGSTSFQLVMASDRPVVVAAGVS